jgi:hypothetical protein
VGIGCTEDARIGAAAEIAILKALAIWRIRRAR